MLAGDFVQRVGAVGLLALGAESDLNRQQGFMLCALSQNALTCHHAHPAL